MGALVRAFSGLDRFEYRSEGSFLAWMTTVLRMEVQPQAGPGPITNAGADEELELLRQAVDSLPPEHAEPVRWAVLEELPLPEVARRLGITEGAARMRVARATVKLTKEFQKLSRSS